jgi:hypothetical protein
VNSPPPKGGGFELRLKAASVRPLGGHGGNSRGSCRQAAVIFITHQVTHAMAVGDHFAVLIRGAVAANFRKGEKTREQITDLMAGVEAMAELDAEVES